MLFFFIIDVDFFDELISISKSSNVFFCPTIITKSPRYLVYNDRKQRRAAHFSIKIFDFVN